MGPRVALDQGAGESGAKRSGVGAVLEEAPMEKRPRLSVEELKHAALKPSTHRTYRQKCIWWGRYLESGGLDEQKVSDQMLEGYVKYLFDNSRIAPKHYEQYLSAVFSRLGSLGVPLPEGKGWRRVLLGCQQLTPEQREQRPPLLPSHYLP